MEAANAWLHDIAHVVSWILLVGGSLFSVIGGIGLLRLPDVFTRMHAAGLTDTLGAGLILAGLVVQAGLSLAAIKLVLILIFLAFTSPTSTHALAKAALAGRVKPLGDETDGAPSPN